MRIVVLDGYTLNPGDNPWDPVAALGELTVYDRTSPEQIIPRGGPADVILTNKTPLDAATLAALGQLKFISVLATGYNVVDLAAARRRGIPVSNVPEYGTESVAEHVFALLLALCRRVEHYDRLVHQGEWERRGEFCFWDEAPWELAGKQMGIIGFGRIGRRVGTLARALGMEVLVYDPALDEAPGTVPIFAGGHHAKRGRRENGTVPFAGPQEFTPASLAAVFARADVVSLHCPLTEDSAGLVNRALLRTMKPTAVLINTARGGLIDEHDLACALNEGRIAGAALDVLSAEPIRADNPLLGAKHCLLTPHLAWASVEARRRLMAITAANIAAFQQGRPIHVVN
jgi:glycerate dehydrogenase